MFSIITTNRNRIAIAPTYTIRYEIPTNPTPRSSRYPAALINTEIRNSTEITGLFDVITSTPDRTAPNASKSSRNVFMVLVIRYGYVYDILLALIEGEAINLINKKSDEIDSPLRVSIASNK